MHAQHAYGPPANVTWKRVALIVAGVLIGAAGVLVAAFMVISFAVVASTGTGAGLGAMLPIGYAAAMGGVAIGALLCSLSSRVGRARAS